MSMTDTFRERDLRDLGINATVTTGERHDLLVVTLSADDLDRLISQDSRPNHDHEVGYELGYSVGRADALDEIRALAESKKAAG